MSELKNIKTADLVLNTGQLDGVPKNPRYIKDNRFEQLKKSIEDAPEMLDYRRLAVYPFNGKYVVLCGNMRLRACKEIGYKEMPCYVLPAETDAKTLREWVIKDNTGFGNDDFDLLANEWDEGELAGWGMELPRWDADGAESSDETGEEEDTTPDSGGNFNYQTQFGVIVMCGSGSEQEEVYNKLVAEGYECKVVSV